MRVGLANEKRGGMRNVLLARVAESFIHEGLRDSALMALKSAIDSYEIYARENQLKVPGVMFMNYLRYGRCLWEMGEKDEAVAYLEGISYKKAESPESQLVQAQVLELLSEYHEDMENRQAFCGVLHRRDSVLELYDSFYDNGRYRQVLKKYKNQKFLREIEEMNRKQESANWWLVLALLVTVGLIVSALIYTWVSWRKEREYKK